jgi:hypothetical protein
LSAARIYVRLIRILRGQPDEEDAQFLKDSRNLRANIPSESSLMTSDTMSILPLFSHTSDAELEVHRIPQHVIAFVRSLNRIGSIGNVRHKIRMGSGLVLHPLTMHHSIAGLSSTRSLLFKRRLDLHNLFLIASSFKSYSARVWLPARSRPSL